MVSAKVGAPNFDATVLDSYFDIKDWLRVDHEDIFDWEMYPGMMENGGFNAVISSLMLDLGDEVE